VGGNIAVLVLFIEMPPTIGALVPPSATWWNAVTPRAGGEGHKGVPWASSLAASSLVFHEKKLWIFCGLPGFESKAAMPSENSQ